MYICIPTIVTLVAFSLCLTVADPALRGADAQDKDTKEQDVVTLMSHKTEHLVTLIGNGENVAAIVPVTDSELEREKHHEMKTYKAAVAQHYTMGTVKGNHEAIVATNLAAYKTIAEKAKEKEAQIIVYPEWGLYGTVKRFRVDVSPVYTRDLVRPFCEEIGEKGCNLLSGDDKSQLYNLANIAKTYEIVVVANVAEIVGKDTDEEKIYNTEVAISANGTLLAKYRKFNPLYKKTFDKPDMEIVTFESFGVTFGLFVCQDIIYPEPRDDLVSLKVKHFPYSVAMPAMLANLTFRGWARKNDVTLLASNLGNEGSNIYSGTSGIAKTEKLSGGDGVVATVAYE